MSGERFTVLFNQHENDLFRFALRLTGSEAKAKDLVQSAALQAYLNRSDVKDRTKFKSWMASILYNAHLSNYRRRKRRRDLMEKKGKYSDSFFNRKTSLNAGYELLKERDILQLRHHVNEKGFKAFRMFMEGYSYQEISDTFDVAIGTVKSRIHTTRKSLGRLCVEHGISRN